MKKQMKWLVAVTALTLTLAGCGSGAPASQGQASDTGAKPDPGAASVAKEKNDPVTLKLYNTNKRLTDDMFAALIADPLKKKYPYITVQMVPGDFKEIQNIR
jgi:multiple sugar transport system substrate-binding protein